MANSISGKIHLIEEVKTYGSKGFRKRVVVLEQDRGSWTNYVPIDMTGEHADVADNWSVGDEIEVEFQLGGRKWQDKYFVSVEAKKWVRKAAERMPAKKAPEPLGGYADDDAPF